MGATVWEAVVAMARERPSKVALGMRPGVSPDDDAFLADAERFRSEGFGCPIVVTLPGVQVPGELDVIEAKDPERELVRLLADGEVDAAVRGALDAATTLGHLKRAFNVPSLCRIALLRAANGQEFFLAPVGVVEGAAMVDRLELVRRFTELAALLGIEPKISVLAEGRMEDRGRGRTVEESLHEAELITKLARDRLGVTDVRMTGIVIEEALEDGPRLVLAPSGPTGNLVFRSLVYLGAGEALGAPACSLRRPFVDVSRGRTDVLNAMVFASAMVAGGWDNG
ncbi:MAG: hypothetical protein QF415_10650 [Candidatus Undinarchaeales archaeon]|nr:hypothetical protein [Candidatus Undinarchaeales archaeon]MDP7494229.1 hypothetical protein [Candidatus Undinarchaeales archaeon]